MNSTPTRADTDDIAIIGSRTSMKIDSESIETAAKLLDRAAQKLENSENALNLLFRSPAFSFGANFPFDLPTGDPALTWRGVENAIEDARFSPPTIAAVQSKTVELSDLLVEVSHRYADQEAEIAASFERGKKLGRGMARALVKLAAEYAATNGPSDPLSTARTYFLGSLLGTHAAISGGDMRGVLAGAVEVSFPMTGVIVNWLGNDENSTAVLQHIVAVLTGEEALGGRYTGEEFAAILYGIFEGAKGHFQVHSYLFMHAVMSPALAGGLHTLVLSEIDAVAQAADLTGLQEVATTRVATISGADPPQNPADLAQRVADQYPENGDNRASQIEVETLTHFDGTQAVLGFFPGMAHAGLHKTHPNDAKGNVQAVQGLETEQTLAMKQILLDMDVPQGTDLVLSGHSKGGMDAINLSTDPEIRAKFDVVLVTTFGSPTELLKIDGLTIKGPQERGLPAATEYLNFSHREDFVPALDMAPPVGRSNQTEIVTDAAKVLEVDVPHAVADAHSMDTYVKTARRVIGLNDPDLNRVRKVGAAALGGPGIISQREVYRVEKIPPDRKE